jgi:hypothetical protein
VSVRRALANVVLLALVVLGTRSLAYALAPGPYAVQLAGQAGGPALPVLTVVAVGGALATAAAILFLATLAVRERLVLEERRVVAAPRLRLAAAATRAAWLFAVALPCCGLLESFVHWRAGLGWHGLACLLGPVHDDMLPLAAALSLVVAALAAAAEHLVAWMRRVAATLAPAVRVRALRPASTHVVARLPRVALGLRLADARGPPPGVS